MVFKLNQPGGRAMAKTTFRNDLIIASDDGKIYKISQAQLAQFEVPFKGDKDYAEVVNLLKAGVQVAAVPVSKEDGGAHARGDMMCYLLNLAGLKTKTSWED
jgi:hypothetical protein